MAARESCPETWFRELDEERGREVRVKRGAAFQFGTAQKLGASPGLRTLMKI
jgi:hypothetical protein